MKKQSKTKEIDIEISEIKAYIRAHGITYAKLSEMTGLSVSTITKIFGGFAKYPRVDTMRIITNALGLSNPQKENTTSNPTINLTEKQQRMLDAFNALIPKMQDYVLEITEKLADQTQIGNDNVHQRKKVYKF